MKKSQKGLSLVEVIVAIAIFSMVSLALFTSVIAMRKVVNRQEEYVKLEMVCYDINAYYDISMNDDQDKTWYQLYFGEYINSKPYVAYLTSEFTPTVNLDEAQYKIRFTENSILSISSINDEIIFVQNIILPIEKEKD